jgi:hypothetical protein
MGGQNHQPCGSFLPKSTKLSLAKSLAMISLETANAELEHVIIAELEDGALHPFNGIVMHLRDSVKHLETMRAYAGELRGQMDIDGYMDLPSLTTMNLERFGDTLLNEGVHVDTPAWKRAVECYQKGGFYEMLNEIDSYINRISQITSLLIEQMVSVRDVAETGELNRVLEENRKGNFRATFASLYSTWAVFDQLFLASSLITSEAWYQFNGHGSLSATTSHTLKSA